MYVCVPHMKNSSFKKHDDHVDHAIGSSSQRSETLDKFHPAGDKPTQ